MAPSSNQPKPSTISEQSDQYTSSAETQTDLLAPSELESDFIVASQTDSIDINMNIGATNKTLASLSLDKIVSTNSNRNSEYQPQMSIDYSEYTPPPWYYRATISILKPLYRMSVWKRSRTRDNYDIEVAQRFGYHYPNRPEIGCQSADRSCFKGVIWCHAVSLGETNTIAPLLEALIEAGYAIWLTNTTQTGYARGESRFAAQIAAGVVSHSYVPVDSANVIDKFLAHVRPDGALFVETELWAIMLSKLAFAKIPALLVNARLSADSFHRYQKIGKVSLSMMQNLSLIIAQDATSAKRFRRLGACSAKIRVAGSLKWVINHSTSEIPEDDGNDSQLSEMTFDKLAQASLMARESLISNHSANDANNPKIERKIVEPAKEADKNSAEHPDQLEALQAIQYRPIWVAASTHAGEESLVLSVHKQLLHSVEGTPAPLLIIVPRHPERFDEVAELVAQQDLIMARRSLSESVSAQTQVYLADTMGEMMTWYQAANVAFVGGSLVDIGGHNPVEPLSVATPVIMGPFTESCQHVVDTLSQKGALYQLDQQLKPDQRQYALLSQLQQWLLQPKQAMAAGKIGFEEVERHQVVLPRQLAIIESVVNGQCITD